MSSLPKKTAFINRIPAFSILPDQVQNEIATLVKTKTVTTGETLFRDTQPAEAVYFINSGKVKLTKSSATGKEILLDIRSKGEVFAEVALFSKPDMTYPANAVILESGAVSYIRSDHLEAYLMSHPELTISLFQMMCDRLRIAQTTLRDVALYGKLSALSTTLLRLAGDYGKIQDDGEIVIPLRLTHEEIGNFFGATRESVSRMMKELSRQGVISRTRDTLTIHNPDQLNEYSTQ